MIKQIMMIATVSTVFVMAGCNDEAKKSDVKSESKDVELDTLDKKVSYIFGYDIARKTKNVGFELNADVMSMAVRDAASGKDPRLTDEEMQSTMTAFQTQQQEKHRENMNKLAEENLSKGEAFLAENAKREGIVQTESGLQYEILKEGDGPIPSAEDKVVVNYSGTLIDGKEFDSSYKRGRPANFRVRDLIPGWVEALQLMPTGSKWKLYIPSELAYGKQGNQNIAPNSALIFEMELLEVKAAPGANQATDNK